MKKKTMIIIIIVLAVLVLGLIGYIVYDKVTDKEELVPTEDYVSEYKEVGLDLTTVMDSINGYWHGSGDNSFYVISFLKKDMSFSEFYYASEGGGGGSIKDLKFVSDNKYKLVITLAPRLLCSEEFCQEGASMGEYSREEDIELDIDLSNISDKKLKCNDLELSYLGATWEEMESNIYN